jgi:DNA-binding transcriptional ArsR family regulator
MFGVLMARAKDDLIWKALADSTRRSILDELRHEPQNTGGLCATFNHVTRQAVIRHLKLLEDAGLVRVEVKGRERINHLNVLPLQQVYERWMRPYESIWAEKLHRLVENATGKTTSRKSTLKPKQVKGKP